MLYDNCLGPIPSPALAAKTPPVYGPPWLLTSSSVGCKRCCGLYSTAFLNPQCHSPPEMLARMMPLGAGWVSLACFRSHVSMRNLLPSFHGPPARFFKIISKMPRFAPYTSSILVSGCPEFALLGRTQSVPPLQHYGGRANRTLVFAFWQGHTAQRL